MKTVLERFEGKYKEDEYTGCWNWIAGKNWTGYGMFKIDGRTQGAHRLSYQLYIGEITDDLCVCHRCDNPSCVNPAHLFLGTTADNMHDRDNKGRHFDNSGEKHGYSKLTEEDVRTIRMMWNNGARLCDLAREFEVTPDNIFHIVHYHTWTKI